MIKHIMMIMAGAIFLAGCQTVQPRLITKELYVPNVPSSYFSCSKPRKPNPDTLTDSQVAKLLNAYDASLNKCRNNIGAINTTLKNARVKARR